MEEVINQLITVGAGLGILGGSWFIWLISGVANNLFSTKKWSWTRMFEDIVKTIIMGIGILSWVVLMNVLDWYTFKLGMDIGAVLDGATVVGLLAVIVGGSANYALKAYRNFASFIGTDHVAQVVDKQDYAGIAQDIKDGVTALYVSSHSQQEDPDAIAGEVLTKAQTKKLAEMGSIPYYKLDISTPTIACQNLLGKGFNEGWGWQCVAGFKEFMFSLVGRYVSAGGAASGYALNKQVRDAVCKLGFTWHDGTTGLQDGCWGIWIDGLYGHVAMYYQGKWLGQNQGASDGSVGTPFNLMALPMQGFAGYFLPNIYSKATIKPGTEANQPTIKPTSPQNSDEVFQKGDKVFLKKYVDVNGTKLANIQSTPYTVFQVRNSDKTVVLKSDDGDIYARVAFSNISKV